MIGLISDVHANVVALNAVLRELSSRRVDSVVCLGDLVGYGPAPNETVERIRSENVLCTLGAADERIAFDFARQALPRKGVGDETLEWTREILEDDHVHWLRALPVQRRFETPNGRMRAFHGSPEDPAERTDLHVDPMRFARLLERNRCTILATGGTHVPYVRRSGNGVAVNPGSVGLSLNGEPGADYAVLDVREGATEVHMDKVEYDVAAVAFDIVGWGLPSVVAEAIQRGRMPPQKASETSEAAEDEDEGDLGSSDEDTFEP